ncbi:MAG: hypothetical protein O8C60_05585 [Candidatus Methanoperedens sp.]|nr:hypothetical protein [Candidatus Methanoperedens sp.]
MFKPNFKYTNKIVKNLVDIASAREVVLNSYLVPKWEVSLRKDALIRATHASTAIEGNPLTIEEVSQLAGGRKVMAKRKAEVEVLNYLRVLEKIEKYREKGKITERSVLKLHKGISKDILEKPEYEGRYRELQVYVGNGKTGKVVFMPPQPEEVPELMGKFGNVLTLILYLREFDIKRFFALDDYYDSDRNSYYRALDSVDPETIDVTQWLEYFTDGVLISITKVKEKVLRLSLEKHRNEEKGQIPLSERQMKIVEHIISKGRITSGEIQKMFSISRQAAHKELLKMIELSLIEQKGAGKAVYYVIK